jgi:hypothetical protein
MPFLKKSVSCIWVSCNKLMQTKIQCLTMFNVKLNY